MSPRNPSTPRTAVEQLLRAGRTGVCHREPGHRDALPRSMSAHARAPTLIVTSLARIRRRLAAWLNACATPRAAARAAQRLRRRVVDLARGTRRDFTSFSAAGAKTFPRRRLRRQSRRRRQLRTSRTASWFHCVAHPRPEPPLPDLPRLHPRDWEPFDWAAPDARGRRREPPTSSTRRGAVLSRALIAARVRERVLANGHRAGCLSVDDDGWPSERKHVAVFIESKGHGITASWTEPRVAIEPRVARILNARPAFGGGREQ